ncbi:hypothetical protein KR100_10000 [Synechococcus sp. KORDI-100]|uniref:hypothetical protein n=1 Tax=Synechococcus sp. KORDI-100 TaxID=1280380 RepID=UPI0004E03D30|nr:hypothetical protein [Synechococcus sp. KORDI-100]AII43691.1 hypothetical protein KR100_10000 [Synechococcus sp. KORDI-100]
MSKKLYKNLRKNNKIIEKDLFASSSDIVFENSADENTSYFNSYDDITGAITTGSYEYDKKGRVDSYSLRITLDDSSIFHGFEIKNSKSFKKHASHLSYILNYDTTYGSLLSDAVASGDCQILTNYLDQLDGIGKGVSSTSSSINGGIMCFA